jgi:hypothetical protein
LRNRPLKWRPPRWKPGYVLACRGLG